jgi:hypothetical protein
MVVGHNDDCIQICHRKPPLKGAEVHLAGCLANKKLSQVYIELYNMYEYFGAYWCSGNATRACVALLQFQNLKTGNSHYNFLAISGPAHSVRTH